MAINPRAIKTTGYLLEAQGLTVGFGPVNIIENLDIQLKRSEILGVVGPSGTGKSVMMRALIGLLPRRGGRIRYFGRDIDKLSLSARRKVERRWGVLFQHGALFSSLTVKENVQVPMREHMDISQELMDELAELTLSMVGLAPNAGAKLPSELSGGMIKRAALARALALNPDILFLDEPTSGLDPVGAAEFDELITSLKETLGLSVFMVTHDLGSLYRACTRIAVLGGKKVMVEGDLDTILAYDDPWVQSYFHGNRAQTVQVQMAEEDKALV
ncbi:MAG: ATP-binding cassette domain-containing protein [Rhodobiaceae bacterium]|nr:ATP-binding cassette domain-containing protein [Rhodobiaceae bacterium]MCC0012160.1 ATP-binding cassette domain-containing protein [Rhodobiaceae bacterium]MCC0052073.1 ATP-binding cassette domain-containing protein [Rhodobiaceae bacterium]MCC0060925.1 ATP-binding cassette domain-containing protein [Rhodobiaceae bacterium]